MSRITEALEELSSREQQMILWTGRGDGRKISSFSEASCLLFDDSGLGDLLQNEPGAFNVELRDVFMDLNTALHQIDENEDAHVIIRSREMERVRELATRALKDCSALAPSALIGDTKGES